MTSCNENGTPLAGPSQTRARIIEALAGGATVTAAADAAGFDRATLNRWLRDDAEFVSELNRLRAERTYAIRGALPAMADDAARTLWELGTSADVPPAVRLRAYLAVLDTVDGITAESVGPSRPEAVRAEWARAEKARRFQELIEESWGVPG